MEKIIKKIYTQTMGCRLNQSESAVIENSLAVNGFEVVDSYAQADIVVVNTCTVTENGDADTRRLVNKIVRQNPSARIALIGCQAQVQKAKLAELPNVRWVIGNAKKFNLAEIFRETEHATIPQIITPTIPREIFTVPIAGIDRSHTRANIKIQDGCDFFCTFCEIPYARGRARSREFDDIFHEVRALVDAGHKEIVLTGINIGTYQASDKSIADVLEILEQVRGLERIRISSIEPTTIPDAVLTKMAAGGKLCRYLHVPLQSGHNEILKRMQRKYTLEEFSAFVRDARRQVTGICIGTDVIVGFPGETDAHFDATCAAVRELPIDYCHVFSYSKRYMAKSREFTDEVPAAVIAKRSEILRDLSNRKRRLFFERSLETIQRVLFEQKKNGVWTGLTDNYIRIHVESHQNLRNQLRDVRLSRIERENVYGEIV